MGAFCGFDIYPPLEESKAILYRKFVHEVIAKYKDVKDLKGYRADGRILALGPDGIPVDTIPNLEYCNAYLWFNIGSRPCIPADPKSCYYFIRFCSDTTTAVTYVHGVYEIAKKYFGVRVHFWDQVRGNEDLRKKYGWYDQEVVAKGAKELEELSGMQRPKEALGEHTPSNLNPVQEEEESKDEPMETTELPIVFGMYPGTPDPMDRSESNDSQSGKSRSEDDDAGGVSNSVSVKAQEVNTRKGLLSDIRKIQAQIEHQQSVYDNCKNEIFRFRAASQLDVLKETLYMKRVMLDCLETLRNNSGV